MAGTGRALRTSQDVVNEGYAFDFAYLTPVNLGSRFAFKVLVNLSSQYTNHVQEWQSCVRHIPSVILGSDQSEEFVVRPHEIHEHIRVITCEKRTWEQLFRERNFPEAAVQDALVNTLMHAGLRRKRRAPRAGRTQPDEAGAEA